MPSKKSASCLALAADWWILWADATMVVWLRSARLMGGGAPAKREAERMVSEKVDAVSEALWDVARLGPANGVETAATALRPFKRRVSANRKRLAKG